MWAFDVSESWDSGLICYYCISGLLCIYFCSCVKLKVVAMTGPMRQALLSAQVSHKTFREVYRAECAQTWQLPCVRTNVFNHWWTAHRNSHVGAISGHAMRPCGKKKSRGRIEARLEETFDLSGIQALIFPKIPIGRRRSKRRWWTDWDHSRRKAEGFQPDHNLESIRTKQSAAPGLIDYPWGSARVVKI